MTNAAMPDNLADTIVSLWSNKDALTAIGIEPTMNHRGCTFHAFGSQEEHWLSSLPASGLPLLDVGACHGVRTILALQSGRDVIALDMCAEHVAILRDRVAKLPSPAPGRLVRAVVAELPDPDAIAPASVSGILCSQVVHFCKPRQVRQMFKHFFTWLAPGGKLVLTVGSWPPRIQDYVKYKAELPHARSPQHALDMLETLPPSELVDAAPGLVLSSDEGPLKDIIGDFLYLLSTVEAGEIAESSGFVVEELRYYHFGKYGTSSFKSEPQHILLVARKPVDAVL